MQPQINGIERLRVRDLGQERSLILNVQSTLHMHLHVKV